MTTPEDHDSGGPGLTHIDAKGDPRMVDVSGKATSARTAVAEGRIRMSSDTLAAIRGGRCTREMSSRWPVWPESWLESARPT